MQMLLIVVGQENQRSFNSVQNGQNTTCEAVDVLLTDGLNNFVATAFEKEAIRIKEHPLEKGSWVMADLVFTVRTAKTERGEYSYQQIRLNKFVAL